MSPSKCGTPGCERFRLRDSEGHNFLYCCGTCIWHKGKYHSPECEARYRPAPAAKKVQPKKRLREIRREYNLPKPTKRRGSGTRG